MSADLDDGAERSFAGRLKRRRAREDRDDTLPVNGALEFGYAAWSVTVAPIGVPGATPEPGVFEGPDAPPRPVADEPRPPAAQERPHTDRDGAGRLRPPSERRLRVAASATEAAPPPPPPPPMEDRPIIAPAPPPRRRTMPEAPSRLDGPRIAPRDRHDADGARHRKAQRIPGGGTVMIDDGLYPLVDWSTGGIAIRSEGHLYRIGDRRLLELEIDLDDYAVNLDLEGEVMNRSSDRTGWRFVAPTETQRQVLRALTQATTGGVAAPPFPRPRAGGRAPLPADDGAPRLRRSGLLAGLAALPFNAVVILVASGIAIGALNDGRLPVVDIEELAAALPAVVADEEPAATPAGPVTAEHAAVAVERLALVAPAAGIVLEWATAPGGSVRRGDPLVSLAVGEADEARSEAVLSPCDCILARVLAVAGETVPEGGDLALLYQSDVEAHVQALFAPGSAPNPGDTVSVTLTYTGEVRDGVVDRVGRLDDPGDFIGLPRAVFADNPADVFAVVRTDPGLPPALAGDPAEVTVRPRS